MGISTRLLIWCAACWLAALAQPAAALGLGNLQVDSHLGQPFEGQIPLTGAQGLTSNDIVVRLASADAFRAAGVRRSIVVVGLRFAVDMDRQVVDITSSQPILEPVLEFIVDAQWPRGRLSRTYAALVGPPPSQATTAAPAAQLTARSTAPAAGSIYGPVRANETLSVIAEQLLPPGTTLDQMMLALLASNPDAFAAANINTLLQGAALTVPALRDVLGIDAESARRMVAEQHRNHRGRRSPVATSGSDQAPDADRRRTTAEQSRPKTADAEVLRLQAQLAAVEEQREMLLRESAVRDARLQAMRDQLVQMQEDLATISEQSAPVAKE